MNSTTGHKSPAGRDAPPQTLSLNFRKIDRRDWWLWSVAIVVTLLLTAGLVSFLLPGLERGESSSSTSLFAPQIVRGLLGLVLLFDIYTLYQQLQIHRIRREWMKREELFRLISENAADLIAVVDMHGNRVYNSLSYGRVLGYSPEELKNSSSFEQIHPEDRKRVKEAAEEARRSGVGQPMEYRFRHKDGTWRVLESTASVIRNSEGESEKIVIVNRDITERKRAVEAFQRAETSFRSVVRDAPYGIFKADFTGKLLLVNPALGKMLGYTSQAGLLAVNLASVYRYPAELQKINELFLSEQHFKDIEVEWKRKDGSFITVRCSGWTVKEDGSAYIEVFAEDVTDRRVLERQLRMAQKMEAVGRLSGGIAHDFNNLLGVIIGYIQVMKRNLLPGQPSYEYAEEVEKAGQRAVTLTRQLLAFSRQQVLDPVILSLNTLVSEMEKMLPRLIGEDIQLNFVLDPVIGQVKADQGQIEQVLMNLVVNARDAMPDGGKLTIQTANVDLDAAFARVHQGSVPGHYVMLVVTDTGTGMDPEIQAQIFEPFFTTKERDKGTGLGLATVYGIVKQSNGYIAVDSEKGKGASFKVYLPRIEQAVATKREGIQVPPTLRGSETVLLVEDAQPLRALAQLFLKENGYHVLTAADGAEAEQVAAQNPGPIHLLLTDVVMPGINGRVLAERLAPRHPDMKVLYMSGYTDAFIAGHGVLEAGTHLLHKPFTEEALVRKVRELLGAGREPNKTDDSVTAEAPLVEDPVVKSSR
ncbi:MAG TPA: PAS domain S-box protein [Candidatus Acidoferrales bacterium]|nr:PAS domain S-box protein [Candidatus Acidoferrales bacterium]